MPQASPAGPVSSPRSVFAPGSIHSRSIADHIRKELDDVRFLLVFLNPLRSQALRGQRRNSALRRKGARAVLEHLEDRCVLANYTAPTASALIADIGSANAAGGANTITLTAPTTSPYQFTAANNGTNGGNFLPVIAANDSLTIVGNGDTIEPAPRHASLRFFDVSASASLTLQNLTLEGGSLVDSSRWGAGQSTTKAP